MTVAEEKWIPVYCEQCPPGPHPLRVKVVNGVAVNIEPDRETGKYLACGPKACVKAYGLIQKMYNPRRVKAPMKRTNPKKGRGIDPGWVEISWEEALDLVAEKLREIQKKGLVNEKGQPRLGMMLGADGTSPWVFGTWLAFLMAWEAVDCSIVSGAGVKCIHGEHQYCEFWHRAFVCDPDSSRCKWMLSLGRGDYANKGLVAIKSQIEGKMHGMKRIHVDPVLCTTGAASDEWIPIKPQGDLALLLAMTNVILYEMDWQRVCDLDFLKKMTNSPYLVGSEGYFVRDPESKKPLIWDSADGQAKPYDSDEIKDFALEGEYEVNGIQIGPDNETKQVRKGKPAFQLLVEHVKEYTPEWATEKCDVSVQTIRRLAHEFVENAMVGATINIDGVNLPLRPVNIQMGKNVNNGWGAYERLWASHVLQILVGSLEVPGGHLGSRAILSGGFEVGEDGFIHYPVHPTDRENWHWPPKSRAGHSTLTPLTGIMIPFSQLMAPTHLNWKWMSDSAQNWPMSFPDVLITHKCNPVITAWDTKQVLHTIAQIPFMVRFAYEFDETSEFADILLPESLDIEATQIAPIGGSGTTFWEQFHEWIGYVARFPAVKVANTMDISDIATELADRVGLLSKYNQCINMGGATVLSETLKEPYMLDPGKKYRVEEIYDIVAKSVTNGKHDLNWFREHGAYFEPFSKLEGWQKSPHPGGWIRPWYLYPLMIKHKARFQLPYQEKLKKTGIELGRRLHEKEISWWDRQIEGYAALPGYHDYAALYDTGPEYNLWATTAHSMQFAWSSVSNPLMIELTEKKLGHKYVQINVETAGKLNLKDEDEVWIESAHGKVKGRIKLREGIRPDTILIHGHFGHYLCPIARDIGLPNINVLTPIEIRLTSEEGSGLDHVKVKLSKTGR